MPSKRNNNAQGYSRNRANTTGDRNSAPLRTPINQQSSFHGSAQEFQAMPPFRRLFSEVANEWNNVSASSTPEARRRTHTTSDAGLNHAQEFPLLQRQVHRQSSQYSIQSSSGSVFSSSSSLQDIANALTPSGSSRSSTSSIPERTGALPPYAQRPTQPPPPPPLASVNPGAGVDQPCNCDGQFTTTTINTLVDLMRLLTGEERCDIIELIDALRRKLYSRGVSEADEIITKIKNLISTQQRLSQCPRPDPNGPISIQCMRESQDFVTPQERHGYVNAYREIIEGSRLMEILMDYGFTPDDLTRHRVDLMQNVYTYLRNLATRQERQTQMDQERHRYNEIIENQQQEIDQLRNDNRNVILQLQRALGLRINSHSTFVNGSGDERR